MSTEDSFLVILRELDDADSLVPCLSLAALIHAKAGDAKSVLAFANEFEQRTELAAPFRARNLPDVARALYAIGQINQASRLLVAEEAVPFPRDRHAIVTAHAIVAEGEGDTGKALNLFRDGAERWREFGFVLEEGQALLGAGRCLLALGRRSEASSTLLEALRTFTLLGATPLIVETNGYLEQATALSS
jgi:tetratricopeptide (TPR) repeat protein